MTRDPYRWWGLRVRKPLGAQLPPLSRLEALLVAALISVLLEASWLVWLILRGAHPTAWSATILTPLMLLLAPVVAAASMPIAAFDALRLSPLIALARERGGLRAWDRWIILACIFAVGTLALAVPRSTSLTAAALALAAGAASFGMGFVQERVISVAGRRRAEIPAWLKEQVLDRARVPGPEPEARSVLVFETSRSRTHKVGVVIPDALLAMLRQLNAQHKGRLWQSSPTAVVRADRPPVDVEAAQILQRLCGQVVAAADADGLTRWELANQVLALVQREISYQFDAESTKGFDGGPFEEYGRFALETVNDRVGDCECTSILCASLLAHLGYRTALVFADVVEDAGRRSAHVMVGVDLRGALPPGIDEQLAQAEDAEGSRFICGETALDGATLAFGILPLSMRHSVRIASVVPIEP